MSKYIILFMYEVSNWLAWHPAISLGPAEGKRRDWAVAGRSGMGTRNRRERGKPETIFISCAYCLPGLGVATNERIGVRGRGPLGSDSRTGAKGDGSVESLDPGHCSARSYSLMDGWEEDCLRSADGRGFGTRRWLG